MRVHGESGEGEEHMEQCHKKVTTCEKVEGRTCELIRREESREYYALSLKKNEVRELLGLEPVSLMIKKSSLRWFGRVKRKDGDDWVKRCMTWEVNGIRQDARRRPGKGDMGSLGLS